MPAAPTAVFSSPTTGLISIVLAILIIAIARFRQLNFPKLSARLFSIGLLLLAAAAAGPLWNHPKPGTIAVMVDLSPSTRGANFRKPDFLRNRLQRLLGSKPYQLFSFADQTRILEPTGPFKEIPCDRTTFHPPSADAIILFSDAQFDPPQNSPPIYIPIDSQLDHVMDASIQKLQLTGQKVVATIANSGPPRSVNGHPNSLPAGPGTFIVTLPISPPDTTMDVELNLIDEWPENDSLSLNMPQWRSQKWWIGANPPENGWSNFSSGQMPFSIDNYLAPVVIVINNQSADRFSPVVLDHLMQYVRDLGGSLLILGGDHAFAAGGYPGTILETLSPLASSPPTPTTHWILLVDGSGSMSQSINNAQSRWQAATQAIVNLLPNLPSADPVQIGQFSDFLKWWLPPQSVADASKARLPPPDAFPHGPTNLQAALNAIADSATPNIPTKILLLSDCDAQIDQPEQLAAHLDQENIRLHVLALGQGSALDIIRKIAIETGGSIVRQFDPVLWPRAAETLFQSAVPRQLMHKPAQIIFENEARLLDTENASLWNRTWLKTDARSLAKSAEIPMAASWRVGKGIATAVAFQPNPSNIDALINLTAQEPRDPRFSIKWDTGSSLHITVNAIDGENFLNDMPITLELSSGPDKTSVPLTQTAPGKYELKMDAPRTAQIATLRTNDEIIDETSIAGRYAPEFDALGNNHATMEKLTADSFGQLIPPTDQTPINFHWPLTTTLLAPWLCALSLLLISTALITARRQ